MKFIDSFIDVTKHVKKLPTSEYLDLGKYPIIDQGQKQIAGYTDIEEGLFTDVPAIIFGDHTRVIKYIDTPFFIGADGVKVIKCLDKQANYNYLYYLLSSVRIPNTGYNRHYKWLKEAHLVEHTKEEQEKIVSVLSTIDNILNLCFTQINKLDELVKSRFVEMFGDTAINSNNFPVYKLNDLCTVSSSKRIYQEEQSSSGVPFLRISNLVELIDNNRVESELFIPEEKYIELSNNDLVPKADDILITSRGTLGKCYIIQEKDKFYFQDGMISWLYNLDKCITPLYITLLFDTRDIKRQIENLQSGSTVAYLSIAMLKKLSIVVPPLDMQQQFADFVAQTDKSKLVVNKQIDKLETLKKSLMQEYFG